MTMTLLYTLELARTLLSALKSSTLIGWAAVAAELLVAWVIYYEIGETRIATFLSESFSDKTYYDRAEVYKKYVGIDATSLAEQSEKFCELVWSDGDLRKNCDRQLIHFSTLGYWLLQSTRGRKAILSLGPHTPIFFWVMLKPYFLQRQAAAGGHWLEPFMEFVQASADFLLKRSEWPLRILDPQGSGKRSIEITRNGCAGNSERA